MNFYTKMSSWALAHKIMATVVALAVVLGGYYGYRTLTTPAPANSYVLAQVARATIISSVAGTGQVSSSNQVTLVPKASGQVVYVGVTDGQSVKAGTLIAQLDDRTAQKAIRDAQSNLDSAQLALKKIGQPSDTLTLTQAQDAITTATQAKSNAKEDLTKAYDDAFTAISNAFLNLPTIVTGNQSILYGYNYTPSQANYSYYYDQVKNYDENAGVYRDSATTDYQTAKAAYDKNFLDYKAASRYSDSVTIENLLNETYATTKNLAQSVKSTDNYLSFVRDRLTDHGIAIAVALTTQQTNSATYTGTINSNLAALLSSKNSIKTAKDTIANSDLTITEKQQSLSKIQAGSDPLDIQSAQLSVTRSQNALQDAREALADYYIRAPFAGVISKVNVKKADQASSGTTIATLITKQQIAQITLNEVDVAKIKVGEKSMITFDAIPDLSISGAVAEIDTVGTVTQGVVTYAVKIGFDTQDDRIKSGMSVSAAVITDIKTDVLAVPNSAVKTVNGVSFVQMFDTPLPGALSGQTGQTGQTGYSGQSNQGVSSAVPPQQHIVQIGISNDTQTEIISGVKEGDMVVSRTIVPTTKVATQAPSLIGGGGNRGGGGARVNP